MRPTWRVALLEAPLVLDGDTTKAGWRDIPPLDLVDVVTGDPPRQATTVRLGHHGGVFYAAFCCEDTDIWGTYRGHDDPLYNEEVVEVFLDPCGLGSAYHELQVSPHGVRFDALVKNRRTDPDGARDLTTLTAWDPSGFRAAARVTGELDTRRDAGVRWEVELAIPLAEVSETFDPARDQMRGNFFRIDRHRSGDEYQALSPTGEVDFHRPDCFGVLSFDG